MIHTVHHYYQVKIKLDELFPQAIEIEKEKRAYSLNDTYADMVDWCVENFGERAMSDTVRISFSLNAPSYSWDIDDERRWVRWLNHFHFKSAADAMMFKLRWVG